MSASLVGSEMCIRDRHCSALARTSVLANCRSLLREPPGRAPHSDLRAPVSYTHLTLPTICSV
eukprot:1060406-Alexandrium_andersonii.AAC.1